MFLISIALILVVAIGESIYDITVSDYLHRPISLSLYSNVSVILIVNVASNCGYTYTNYRELMDLHSRLHPRGLQVLAFPCNQFGEQEPGTDAEVHEFVTNYGIDFPVFAKVQLQVASSKLRAGWLHR
jgi:glutathione peroxidase-family protein